MTPTSPPHACATPGCAAVVYGKRSHCPKHEESNKRRKLPEQARFYSSRYWRALSELVRKQEPVCRLCRTRPSAVTDHVDGDYMNNARANLRALCVECNETRTARQHRAKVDPA